jgi:hypothetical protein
VSVLGTSKGRDTARAVDLCDLAETALDLANCIRALSTPDEGPRVSNSVSDELDALGADRAINRLMSSPIVMGCLVYTGMTEEGRLAPPDLRVSGAPDETADRIRRTLLRFADDVSRVSRVTEMPAACVAADRLERDANELLRLLRIATEMQVATLKTLGSRVFQLGEDEPFTVTPRENDVLEAFIGMPAMDERTLRQRSRQEEAAKILRNLRRRSLNGTDGYLMTAISCPGGKSQGGYRVAVEVL